MGSRNHSSAPLLACNLHDGRRRRRRRAGQSQASYGWIIDIRTNRAKEPEVAGQMKVKLGGRSEHERLRKGKGGRRRGSGAESGMDTAQKSRALT